MIVSNFSFLDKTIIGTHKQKRLLNTQEQSLRVIYNIWIFLQNCRCLCWIVEFSDVCYAVTERALVIFRVHICIAVSGAFADLLSME